MTPSAKPAITMKTSFSQLVPLSTLLTSLLIANVSSVSAEEDFTELGKTARMIFQPLPESAENVKNKSSDAKLALGKKLYFEKRLSKDNTQSCNTCHNLDTYGVDNQALSKGNDGGLGGRNSPTVLNAALHVSQFWDGREPDVEAQAGGPILNPVEMAMPSEETVVKRLSGIQEYPELFAKAFPENPKITYDNLKMAIGAFERKLITPSKFDVYLKGDDQALTSQEKAGLKTFIETGCVACHIGPLLGGNMFQKFGVYGEYWKSTKSANIDKGRFDLTKKESDMYFFKVPSLRNIEKTGPYFHDGSVADLKDAIKIMSSLQLKKELTTKQVDDLAAFLNSLTGEVSAEWKK